MEVVALSRFYASKKGVLASAEKLGVPVFTTIDAPLPVLFNMTNIWIRRLLFPLLVFFFALVTLYGPLLYRLVGMIFLMLSPFLYFAVFAHNKKRDDFMANYIVEKVKKNRYNNILVSCGDAHVDGIARDLEAYGIEVDAKRTSKHPILKIVLVPIILVIILILIVLIILK
jgi:Ca2+/Na+ antiporter